MKKRIFALLCLGVLLVACAMPILAEEAQTPTEETQEPARSISVPVVGLVIAVGAVLIALAVVLPTAIKAKRNP